MTAQNPPWLAHGLDRDSSGILIMGRTQTSATMLHSIFREKTFGASNNNIDTKKRILPRRYWALVIGSPRRPRGLISAPLEKVVVDDGKSERITIVDNVQNKRKLLKWLREAKERSLSNFWILAMSSRCSNCSGMLASNQTSKADTHGHLLHDQLWTAYHFLFIYLFILPFPYPLILKKWFLKPHFANNSPNFGFQIVLNLKEIFRPCRVLGMKIPFLVKFGRHFLSGKPLSNLLWFLGCFKISVNLFSWFLAIEFTKFIHSK